MAFTPYKVMSMIRRDPVWPAARRAPRGYACSRMGARARVGLPPEGAGRPVGPGVRGLVSGRGSSLGLDFWKKWQFIIIISRKL